MEKESFKKTIVTFLGYLFLLIPYFSVPYFKVKSSSYSQLINIWTILSGFIIIILVLARKKYPKIMNYIILYLGVLLLSTFLFSKRDILFTLFFSYQNITLCLLTDYGMKKNKITFLRSLEFILAVLVLSNFFSIIFNPNGLYINAEGYMQNWILGYKNSHILYIIPLLLVSLIKSYYLNGKMSFMNYFYFILSFISTLLVRNSTGIVGLSIISVLLFIKNHFKEKRLNIKSYFVTYIILFFSLVIFKVQNLFSFLIVNILKKDLTLTGRIYIWDAVIQLIKKQKLLGYGNVTFQYNAYIFTTHNTILDIVYKSGVLGCVLYFIIILLVIKQLNKTKDNKISSIFSIILFSLFVMMLTEAYAINYYLYILIMAYNIKQFIKGGDLYE